MHLHRKRPYEKPALAVIPVDSPRFSELMQSLSQGQENAEANKQTDNSHKKEADAYV